MVPLLWLWLSATALAAEFAPLGETEFGAAATRPAWSLQQYGYIANNESLRSLIFDFGATIGVPLIVSDRINLVVDATVPSMPAVDFLNHLHSEYQVIWVFDGATLYLYDADEVVARTIPLSYSLRQALQQTLEASNVIGQLLQWTVLPTANLLQVSGPPRFVELVDEIVSHLGAMGGAGGGPAGSLGSFAAADEDFEIRIFRIEHGYVDSAANNASGAKAPIVSLAEMVAKLMNVAHVSSVSSAARGPGGAMRKLRGEGVIQEPDADPAEAAQPLPSVGVRGSGEEAFVIGDPRLNAVIVRDLKQRMPAYERLIAELDVPVDQVEIGVSVLDIDANEADEWRISFETDDALVTGNASEFGNNLEYSQNQLDVDGVAVRLRALRESARSRVLTQPSIVTLDNQEASFQNNRTFYVRLGGERSESVDLAPVSYGWVVRIRPHIVYAGGPGAARSIQLAVHLEDGARGAAALAVTGVPEVAQNVIQTQAIVQEGNSLLVGGYIVREQRRFDQRIPFVGRVPIVGRLFSTRNDRDHSLARYFLITPRILPATIHHELDPGFEGAPIDPGVAGAVRPDAATGPAEEPADAVRQPSARAGPGERLVSQHEASQGGDGRDGGDGGVAGDLPVDAPRDGSAGPSADGGQAGANGVTPFFTWEGNEQFIQFGAFVQQESAENLAFHLRGITEVPVTISAGTNAQGATLQRVRLGPIKGGETIRKLSAQLAEHGYSIPAAARR